MKKSKKGIIAAVIVIIAAVLGISGAFNDSEDKPDYETTTFEERIITNSDEESIKETKKKKTTITTTKATTTESKTVKQSTAESERHYILNKNTMKFHYPSCRGVKDMKEKNKQEFTGSRQDVIDKGYTPCGICHP